MAEHDDRRLLDELADALHAEIDLDAQPDPQRMAAFQRAVAERASGAGVGAGGQRAPVAPRGLGWLRRPRLAAGVALAVLALVGGGVLVGQALDSGGGDGPGVVEYAGPIERLDGRDVGTLEVREIAVGRTVDLRTDKLPILPRGEYYEVWFVGPGDRPARPNRISAGTFHPDRAGRSNVVFKAAVDPALYPELVITAEPGDGDPAPSGDDVLRARLD